MKSKLIVHLLFVYFMFILYKIDRDFCKLLFLCYLMFMLYNSRKVVYQMIYDLGQYILVY